MWLFTCFGWSWDFVAFSSASSSSSLGISLVCLPFSDVINMRDSLMQSHATVWLHFVRMCLVSCSVVVVVVVVLVIVFRNAFIYFHFHVVLHPFTHSHSFTVCTPKAYASTSASVFVDCSRDLWHRPKTKLNHQIETNNGKNYVNRLSSGKRFECTFWLLLTSQVIFCSLSIDSSVRMNYP